MSAQNYLLYSSEYECMNNNHVHCTYYFMYKSFKIERENGREVKRTIRRRAQPEPGAERRKIIQKLKKSFIWIEGEVLHKWVRQAMGKTTRNNCRKCPHPAHYYICIYYHHKAYIRYVPHTHTHTHKSNIKVNNSARINQSYRNFMTLLQRSLTKKKK